MRFALALIAFAALAYAQRSIVETAVATPQLSTLVSVLTLPAYAPVLNLLSGPGPFTVFAPNNAAFAQANIDPNQVALVTAVLQYHVLSGRVLSTDLAPGANIATTLLNNPAYVNLGNGVNARVNAVRSGNNVQLSWSVPTGQFLANVVAANVICTNGVVHIIDRVMFFPDDVPTTARNGGLTTLVEAVVLANLANAVTNTAALTIFGPTNGAFAAVNWRGLTPAQLVAVLTYHVVPAVVYSTQLSNGQRAPTLNGQQLVVNIVGSSVGLSDTNGRALATVALPNVLTKNGVVHVIDRVMVPPQLEKIQLNVTSSF